MRTRLIAHELERPQQPNAGDITDYVNLTKPRVVLLQLLVAFATMILAANGMPPAPLLAFTLIGGGLATASSNAFNCFFDRDLDVLMERTRGRPLPSGRITPSAALLFGAAIGTAGLIILGLFVNVVAAALAAAAIGYYVLVYTLWLKRRTQWSAVIGSGAGAFTPLIAWAAVTGGVGWAPVLLFLIIVLWTMPHFWSLIIFRRDDYESAGIRAPSSAVINASIIGCVCALPAVCTVLAPVAHLGPIYLAVSACLGLPYIVLALRLVGSEAARPARQLFYYSLIYLVFLLGGIIVDKALTHL